jgi:hypothetical protein
MAVHLSGFLLQCLHLQQGHVRNAPLPLLRFLQLSPMTAHPAFLCTAACHGLGTPGGEVEVPVASAGPVRDGRQGVGGLGWTISPAAPAFKPLEGTLWKRPGGRRKKSARDLAAALVYQPWKPRWFLLCDGVLVYFKHPNPGTAAVPQGVIMLDSGLQAHFGFEVTPRASEFLVATQSRRVLLAAPSPLVGPPSHTPPPL